jgi:hypothetical protein
LDRGRQADNQSRSREWREVRSRSREQRNHILIAGDAPAKVEAEELAPLMLAHATGALGAATGMRPAEPPPDRAAALQQLLSPDLAGVDLDVRPDGDSRKQRIDFQIIQPIQCSGQARLHGRS